MTKKSPLRRLALKSDVWVPVDASVMVEKGWITLRGQAKWEYQRQAAENAVRYLPGVKGTSSNPRQAGRKNR